MRMIKKLLCICLLGAAPFIGKAAGAEGPHHYKQ